MFQNHDESGVSEAAEYANVKVVDGKSPGRRPAASDHAVARGAGAKELSMRHAINGRIFGNLQGLEMTDGERVRWYLFALGTDPDVHTAHWHGEHLKDGLGHTTDVIELMPGTMKSADMLADNPGDWMIHCHVGDQMMEGYGSHTILPKGGRAPAGEPLFGLAPAVKSVRWQAAEGDLDGNSRFKATCVVTDYANLPLWNTRLGIKVGGLKARTGLDKSGAGSDGGVKFKVLNGDPSGIVQSNILEIELNFSGSAWRAILQAGLKDTGTLPLDLSVDDTVHPCRIPLKVTGTKAELIR